MKPGSTDNELDQVSSAQTWGLGLDRANNSGQAQNGIEGDWRSLTKEEDLELEERLKHLNKPAVKTIQMKPTSLPNRSRDQVSLKDGKPLHIGLKGRGCLIGTVPIRRTTKEDLIREKLASKIMTPTDDTGGVDT
ncbi:hypothetical protein ACSBR1_024421 [Camellia fascicularis]